MKRKRSKSKEIQLKEYAEAASLCRSYEQLSRTGLAIFIPFAMAVIAYVLRESTQVLSNIILSLLGLIVSVFTWAIMFRVRAFYHVAKTKAIEIEKKLYMDLYQRLDTRFKGHYITPSNKIAMMWIVGIFTVSFACLLGWELYLYWKTV